MDQFSCNSDVEADKTARQAIVALRETCKISRTAFALMIGMGAQALQEKEKGRLRYKPEELARAKHAVQLHLAKAAQALDSLPF